MKEGYKKQGFLNPAFFVPSYNKWIYYWVSTQFLITFSRAIRFHLMQSFSIDQIKLMDRFTRTHFINTLSGFKSVSLIGTLNKEGQANLAIFSNLVHLGADPALIGFINRPWEAASHTLTNIQETEFYTVNHVHKGIYTQAHQTSAKYPAHVSEFEAVGLRPLFRPGISAPFVEESKVQYLLKLEEIIQETTEEQNTELQIQLQNKDHQLEMKTEELETIKTNKTTLYIYNMDTRVVPSEVKIGVTLNLHKRIKPYKQISKHGNVEFSVYLEDINVKSLEQYIHLLLKPYRVDGEVFRIDVEEAKCIMMGVVNRSKILSITNVDERQHKLLKLFEQERSIINDESIINISTRDMSCQTDFNDDVPLSYPIITTNVELYKKFDLYIEECCLIGENFEVNTDDIMGQFRIWNKKVSDDLKFAFLNYLKRRFSDENKDDYKLKKQDKNQVQYGYKGVMLKHIDYGKVVLTHDIEVFIYERCRFSSGGKSQVMTLINEYKDWKRTTNKPHVSTDEKELRKYLNNHPHLCASVVWKPTLKIVNEDGTTNEIKNKTQSNDGYYGISLKREDEHHYKNTSSKGKKVEKRDYATDTVLATYETIAKAMSETKITVLSTAIKNKRVFNNEYYFCIANKYV